MKQHTSPLALFNELKRKEDTVRNLNWSIKPFSFFFLKTNPLRLALLTILKGTDTIKTITIFPITPTTRAVQRAIFLWLLLSSEPPFKTIIIYNRPRGLGLELQRQGCWAQPRQRRLGTSFRGPLWDPLCAVKLEISPVSAAGVVFFLKCNVKIDLWKLAFRPDRQNGINRFIHFIREAKAYMKPGWITRSSQTALCASVGFSSSVDSLKTGCTECDDSTAIYCHWRARTTASAFTNNSLCLWAGPGSNAHLFSASKNKCF